MRLWRCRLANRVLIHPDGMKISKPGVDVLSASNAQLLFSSDWTHPSLWLRGTIIASYGVTTTVYFGKSFSRPPFVFGTAQNASGGHFFSNSTDLAYLQWDHPMFLNRPYETDPSIPYIEAPGSLPFLFYNDRFTINGTVLQFFRWPRTIKYSVLDYAL